MTQESGLEEKAKATIKHVDDNEFKNYFDRLESSDEGYEIRLYRRVRSGKKLISTYLKKYVDELPEEEAIGEEFGGGNYMLLHYQDGGNRLEKTIWIDEIFTKRLEERKRVSGNPPNQVALAQGDPLEYFSRMVKDMLKPMMDLFAAQQAQAAPVAPNTGEVAIRMIESMTEAMAASLSRVQSTIIDRQLDRLDKPQEKPEPVMDKMSFVKEIIELAKGFGETFLNSNGIKSKMMSKVIAESDEFKTIKEDPDMFDALYTEAVNDPEIGKDKADKLFEKLGFNIGKEESRPGAEQ